MTDNANNKNDILTLSKVIEKIKEKIEIEKEKVKNWKKEIKYSELEEIIGKFKDKLNDEDYCILKKWLENNFWWDKTKNKKDTFWANFVDLINNWFFFKDKVLMWSFAEESIKNLAKLYKIKILLDSYSINKKNFEKYRDLITSLFVSSEIIKNKEEFSYKDYEIIKERLDKLEKIKNNIWDEFLKQNLLYL